MAKKANNKPDRSYDVGDQLKVKLHDGRTVDATVWAVVDDGDKLQVDFGHEDGAGPGEPDRQFCVNCFVRTLTATMQSSTAA